MKILFERIKSNPLYNSIISSATPQNCCYFLVFSVLIFIAYFFLRLPILSTGDTDLWYHLSGGRYFSQFFKIPDSGFFSFIAESRQWDNYYWLFGVIVYYTHNIFGYYGLVTLKALFFILTISTIAVYLFKNETNPGNKIYFTTIFICFCIALIPRYYAIMRPHMFSYLFIPAFVYMLEYRPRLIYIMPILAVILANSHGVEYPVLVLLCLSYLIEYYINKLRHKGRSSKENLIYLVVIVITVWAILINPGFNKLLTAPFEFARHQYLYISEIKKINLGGFFTFKLWPVASLFWGITNILIIAACIGAIKGLLAKSIRVSHLLLLIGGVFLLTRSQRFQYEAMLLALPMLKSQMLLFKREKSINQGSLKSLLITSCVFILSFYLFFSLLSTKARYPFSESHLPKGVVAFLNHVDTGGSVLNNPNHGGYLQWRLSPKYKIAMDLQMVLFQDDDYFMVSNALSSKEGLAYFKEQYNPDYIINDRNNNNFNKIIEELPSYKPVFFDFAFVLYANMESLPKLKHHELKYSDPYSMLEEDLDNKTEKQINEMLNELISLNAISPDDMLVNFQMGRIFKKKGDLKKAYKHADDIISNYPESAYGYTLMGDILNEDKKYIEAIKFFKKGLDCQINWTVPILHKKIAMAYSKIKDYKKAYKNMSKVVKVFSPLADYKDIWMLGNMAIMADEIDEGIMLLKFALIKTPYDDEAFRVRIIKQLESINPL